MGRDATGHPARLSCHRISSKTEALIGRLNASSNVFALRHFSPASVAHWHASCHTKNWPEIGRT